MTQNSINNRPMGWTSADTLLVAMFPNNGYIDNNSSPDTPSQYSLPTSIRAGDRITILNNARQPTVVTQSTGQQILWGDIVEQVGSSTTVGATGTLSIGKLYTVTLICVVENLTFIVESYTGQLVPT